jgi:hypothetical protein
MPDATASAGPLTVIVHAALGSVEWDFGDGASSSSGTDIGQPYPARSHIQHVYQTDSFGITGGYTITARLSYRVTYSVNGGPSLDLGSKSRVFTSQYAVNQLQPEAVPNP